MIRVTCRIGVVRLTGSPTPLLHLHTLQSDVQQMRVERVLVREAHSEGERVPLKRYGRQSVGVALSFPPFSALASTGARRQLQMHRLSPFAAEDERPGTMK